MTSDPERLDACLKNCFTQLDEVHRLVRAIPLEPKKQNCIDLGEAIGLLIQIQKHLLDKYPELRVEDCT